MLSISDCELASIQDAMAAALDLDCTISRIVSPVQDAWGSQGGTPSVVAAVKAGLEEPTVGELAPYASKIGSARAWKVHLPLGTDARTNDILTIAGTSMRVQGSFLPHSWPMTTDVLASETG